MAFILGIQLCLETGLDDYAGIYVKRFLPTGVIIKEKKTNFEGFQNVCLNITVAKKI